MVHLRLFTAALALGMTGLTHAADAATERAAVQAEMRGVEATYAAEEAACGKQFIVTACVDDTRRRKRDALAPLRARLLAIDDTERRQRAQERVKAVEEKRRAVAERPLPPELAAASAPRRNVRPPAAHASRPETSTAQRERAAGAAAAERAAASARRQDGIAQDAERIRQRMEERERKGKKSAPLPAPGASAVR